MRTAMSSYALGQIGGGREKPPGRYGDEVCRRVEASYLDRENGALSMSSVACTSIYSIPALSILETV